MYIFLSNVSAGGCLIISEHLGTSTLSFQVIQQFHLEVVNETEIEPILQMVTVPNANIKLKLTPR